MTTLLRPSVLFGKHGRLGVGRTKFFEDYVHRNDGHLVQFVAGTRVRRLRLVRIGPRAVAAISDEVDQLIEALRSERDASSSARHAHIVRERSGGQDAADIG
jgi:hypothetical protein